jgi:hypothetical protein
VYINLLYPATATIIILANSVVGTKVTQTGKYWLYNQATSWEMQVPTAGLKNVDYGSNGSVAKVFNWRPVSTNPFSTVM